MPLPKALVLCFRLQSDGTLAQTHLEFCCSRLTRLTLMPNSDLLGRLTEASHYSSPTPRRLGMIDHAAMRLGTTAYFKLRRSTKWTNV